MWTVQPYYSDKTVREAMSNDWNFDGALDATELERVEKYYNKVFYSAWEAANAVHGYIQASLQYLSLSVSLIICLCLFS